MARIFGKDGYQRLLLGREININDIKTRTCTIAKTDTSSNAVAGVMGGELLVYTDRTQVYAPASKADDKVAGICLGTNVKLDPYFPESADEVKFIGGDACACVIQGDVAVRLDGTQPKEGAAVYYDFSKKAFTTSNSGTIACANMEFRGISEGSVTVVRVRY
jgi:hypothetical protein|nr:MAG TPA: hypothetical protein [Caudoviricetes sp.]